MDIQLVCSDSMKEKMDRVLSRAQINVVVDAKIALVESGCELPTGRIAVVFDPIDFIEAVELLRKNPNTVSPLRRSPVFSIIATP